MCDVLFVTPSNNPKVSTECYGTLLLATILRNKGLNVDVFRFYEADTSNGFEAFVKESTEKILHKNPKIVSFYCRCDSCIADIMIAKQLKKENPLIYVVFGGPQADATSSELLKNVEWIDYCCCGEGEDTVFPLFSSLLKNESPTDINGLVYRNVDGEIISNPRPELKKNLDENPIVDYSLIPSEIIESSKNNNIWFPIEVGRGCPFNCAFCSTSLFWKRKFRLLSNDRIIEEMTYLNEKFGIRHFSFNHDLFTANKTAILDFCSKLKENNNDFIWGCSSRTDTIDVEMIEAMASAGLKSIYFGIETGSPRMQKIIHKNLDLDHIKDISKVLAKHKIIVTASFIYGFPEETEEDLEKTLQFIRTLLQLKVRTFQLHLCALFPGTEYYNKYKDRLTFADHYSDQVVDFGLKENFDFIYKHKEIFPFYYEYHNSFREKFAQLSKLALPCIELYNLMIILDPNRFKDMRLVDFYLDFFEANNEKIVALNTSKEVQDKFYDMTKKYLSVFYNEGDFDKLCAILNFENDKKNISLADEDITEIKNYNADIKAYTEGKSIYEISDASSMVIIRKTGKTLNYIIKYI